MNKEYQHSEMIEAYLRDELSAEQRADFEQLVRQDPLLYNEFLLQKEIITNIQNFRKAQLKNRLNQIDVSNTPSWNSAGSAGVWLGGLVLVGLLSWLGYSYFQNQSPAITPAPVAVTQAPAVGSEPESTHAETQPETAAGNTSATDAAPAASGQSQVAAKNSIPAKAKTSAVRASNVQQPALAEAVYVKPDSEINPRLQEDAIRKADVEAEPLTDRPTVYGNTASNRLNVVDNTNEKLKLHYYYQNGRIALLGFDKPYTFLDMPSDNVTYLYYEDNFYKLNLNQTRPAPIQNVRITDEALVKSLRKMLTDRK